MGTWQLLLTKTDWPVDELRCLQVAHWLFTALKTRTPESIGVTANIDQLGFIWPLSVSIRKCSLPSPARFHINNSVLVTSLALTVGLCLWGLLITKLGYKNSYHNYCNHDAIFLKWSAWCVFQILISNHNKSFSIFAQMYFMFSPSI